MSPNDKQVPDSTVMKLLKGMEQQRQQEEKVIENVKEYTRVLNKWAGTENGRYILKHLEKYAKIYSVSKHSDVVRMAEERGTRNFYLEMIHQFLNETNRQEIR